MLFGHMSKKLCWHARNFYRYLLYPYRAFIWGKYIIYMARISPSSSAPKNDCKVLWNRTKNNMERLQLKYQLHNKETNRNPKKIISIIIAGHVICLYNVIFHINPMFRNDREIMQWYIGYSMDLTCVGNQGITSTNEVKC